MIFVTDAGIHDTANCPWDVKIGYNFSSNNPAKPHALLLTFYQAERTSSVPLAMGNKEQCEKFCSKIAVALLDTKNVVILRVKDPREE
jgi:hypothetical protein